MVSLPTVKKEQKLGEVWISIWENQVGMGSTRERVCKPYAY